MSRFGRTAEVGRSKECKPIRHARRGKNAKPRKTGVWRKRLCKFALPIGKKVRTIADLLRQPRRGDDEDADGLLKEPPDVKKFDGIRSVAASPDRQLRPEPDLLIGIEVDPLHERRIVHDWLLDKVFR